MAHVSWRLTLHGNRLCPINATIFWLPVVHSCRWLGPGPAGIKVSNFWGREPPCFLKSPCLACALSGQTCQHHWHQDRMIASCPPQHPRIWTQIALLSRSMASLAMFDSTFKKINRINNLFVLVFQFFMF